MGLGNFNPDPTGGIVFLLVSQFSLEISSSKMMLMFLLKPVVVVVLLALVLIFRCLLCLGIGSGVLRELQSELLLDDADDEELEQAEDVEEASEELHEDVLMLDDAE